MHYHPVRSTVLTLLLLAGTLLPSTVQSLSPAQLVRATASASRLTSNQSASPFSARIDQLVRDTLTPGGPGVAVLVLQDGKKLHAKGYGYASVRSQRRITTTTNFDLASVSKQMTAVALLKLVEDGQVDLEAPVNRYLPELKPGRQPVTLLHLLHHTSGLADYTGYDWTAGDEEFSRLDLEAHLVWLSEQPTHAKPGERFEYNNSGYALLALVVQRVAGIPYWRFVEQEIFAPLGMVQSRVYHRLGQTIPNQALGYVVDDEGVFARSEWPTVMAGDGNVYSSLADLARYDAALRAGTLLSPELLALAFTPGTLDNGKVIEEDGDGYGFGWGIGENYVDHTGSWWGTSTYYLHYLDEAVTIIVLSNDETYDAYALADAIAAELWD